ENRIMRLAHRRVAIEHVVKALRSCTGPRRPDDFVIAQTGDADRADLDHAEFTGARRCFRCEPEIAAQAEPVEQERAQLAVRRRPHYHPSARPLTPASSKVAIPV